MKKCQNESNKFNNPSQKEKFMLGCINDKCKNLS